MSIRNILVVEDSPFFGLKVKRRLEAEGNTVATWVKNLAGARAILKRHKNKFFAAILDFCLPDAPEGEIVAEVVATGIPVIVLTASMKAHVREYVWSHKVVDYVLKENNQALEYVVALLDRLEKNSAIKVLVVDDSHLFRKSLTELLLVQRYNVVNTDNGKKALEILKQHPDIKLVITDYQMPEMDGLELIEKIRKKFNKNELGIIGISSELDKFLSASFIKLGANDFIIKQSFITEEFYSRVTQCIQNLEHIDMIREAAIKDALTGLYNRRYFYDTGEKLFADAVRENARLTCAMIDIDNFKQVNDTHGHATGDRVLRNVAGILTNRMRESDIVARLGGEEFCILSVNMEQKNAKKVFENIRKMTAKSLVKNDENQKTGATISIGVATNPTETIEEMIKRADQLLYDAKERGRNKVVIE